MRLKLASLCAAAALFASAGAAYAVDAHTTAPLNFRTGPGYRYAVFAEIPGGSWVNVTKCGYRWCLVEYGGAAGYVASNFVVADAGVAFPVLDILAAPIFTPWTPAAPIVASY